MPHEWEKYQQGHAKPQTVSAPAGLSNYWRLDGSLLAFFPRKGSMKWGTEMGSDVGALAFRGGSRIFRGGVAEPQRMGQFGPRGPHMAPNLVLQLGILVLRAPFLSLWARFWAKINTFHD